MRPLQQRPTNYGEVGATAKEDFDRFPPKGYTIVSHRTRIGHGRARYDAAVAGLRTWQVQRSSGIRVEVVPAEDNSAYRAVGFEKGTPTRSAGLERAPIFNAEGEPFLYPGDSAMQYVSFLGRQWHAPIRVIALQEEPDSHEVIFGSLEGHPLAGEERMTVSITDDDSVYFQLRVMSRPATPLARLGWARIRRLQTATHQRFMDSLRRLFVV